MWGPEYLLCLYSCVLWATKYNLLKSHFTAYQHTQVTLISRSYRVGHVLCLHSVLLPTATSTTGCNRAFCINCLHLLLSSIIKQIFIECLLCARPEVRTVGIQQWIKQSLPLRPSSSEEKENRFMKSYNARLNLSSLPPSLFFFPLFVPSCFSLWTMWVCPSFCAWCLESLGKLYVRETMILFFREPEAGESLNNSILVFSSRFLP